MAGTTPKNSPQKKVSPWAIRAEQPSPVRCKSQANSKKASSSVSSQTISIATCRQGHSKNESRRTRPTTGAAKQTARNLSKRGAYLAKIGRASCRERVEGMEEGL